MQPYARASFAYSICHIKIAENTQKSVFVILYSANQKRLIPWALDGQTNTQKHQGYLVACPFLKEEWDHKDYKSRESFQKKKSRIVISGQFCRVCV